MFSQACIVDGALRRSVGNPGCARVRAGSLAPVARFHAPVVVYSLVLACMGISAILADLGTPLAGFGALLFIASDAMIAISKFRGSFLG
ncbi:MAG: lysoplasmalogenase, partial [Acidobacteriia bacterium]|nr:lysoplasmalogenase [Terriglobia bacterium]